MWICGSDPLTDGNHEYGETDEGHADHSSDEDRARDHEEWAEAWDAEAAKGGDLAPRNRQNAQDNRDAAAKHRERGRA